MIFIIGSLALAWVLDPGTALLSDAEVSTVTPESVSIALTPSIPGSQRPSLPQATPIEPEPSPNGPPPPVWPPPPPLPSGVDIPAIQLNRLIEELASDNLTVSSTAERRLLRGGASAIPALTSAVKRQPEVYHRLIPALLERILRECDSNSSWAAEQALSELTEFENDFVYAAAAESLENCEVPRIQQAIVKIRETGGHVEFSNSFFEIDLNGELYPSLKYVAIDEHWKAAEATLQLLARLPHLRMLYLIEGHPLTEGQLRELKTSRPEMQIETRSRANLGVLNSFQNPTEIGVTLGALNPKGSAAKAGLKSGDIILKFDGKDVYTFPDLLKALRGRVPGDVVEVKFIRREGEEDRSHLIKVKLQAWTSEP